MKYYFLISFLFKNGISGFFGWLMDQELTLSLADKYDRLVDMHCDEIDNLASRNLEVLAANT